MKCCDSACMYLHWISKEKGTDNIYNPHEYIIIKVFQITNKMRQQSLYPYLVVFFNSYWIVISKLWVHKFVHTSVFDFEINIKNIISTHMKLTTQYFSLVMDRKRLKVMFVVMIFFSWSITPLQIFNFLSYILALHVELWWNRE